ncbi:MAG: DinB family protein [Acidobacteriota bacterium]
MLSELIDDNVALLEQSAALIAAMPNGAYGSTPPGKRGGPGAHLRHLLDHYSALLDGVAGGRIDYEARAREPQLEVDPDFACLRIERIIARLKELAALERGAPLHVVGDGHATHSTLGRELQFLLSHTVHHQALIVLLAEPLGVIVDSSFGVAPSTLRHWGRLAPAAPLRQALEIPLRPEEETAVPVRAGLEDS